METIYENNSVPADQAIKAWDDLIKLAREIDPNIPEDLIGYEVRITFNKDYYGVECIKR